MTRTAIYCRISREDQAAREKVEDQETSLRALCERRGFEVAAIFAEKPGTSAYAEKRKRPEFDAMMTAVERGDFDVIAVKETSRLYRTPEDATAVGSALQRAGVKVETLHNGTTDMSTVEGRFTARVSGAVNMSESERISERQRDKMARVAAKGGAHGGRRPYGFKVERVEMGDGRVIKRQTNDHEPSEVAHIRDAVEGLLSGRYPSLRQTALALERNGARASGGATFKETTLRRLLTSPRLNGRREHDGATYPAAWDAIVTDAEHEQLVAMFPARARTGMTYQTSRHLLAGLLRCGKCGTKMTFRPVGAGSYACPSKPRGCNAVTISAGCAEAFVIEMASVAINQPRVAAASDDVEPLSREVASLEARADGFADDYALGVMDRAQFERVNRVNRERRDELRSQIDARAAVAVQASREAATIDTWATLDYSERRDALRVLVRRIVVNGATGGSRQGRKFDPERVRIEFNIHTGTDGAQHGPDGILDTDHALVIA